MLGLVSIALVFKKALASIGELQNGPFLKRRYCNNPFSIFTGLIVLLEVGMLHKLLTVVHTWSCKFLPTPGRGSLTSISTFLNGCSSPMPESNKSWGDLIAPAERITSLLQYIFSVRLRPVKNSTPIALSLSIISCFTI